MYYIRCILVISSQILGIRIIEKYCKIPNHSYFCHRLFFLSVCDFFCQSQYEKARRTKLQTVSQSFASSQLSWFCKICPNICPARWKSLTIYSSQLLPQSCYSHKLTTELIFGESCSERPRSAAFISTAFSSFSN